MKKNFWSKSFITWMVVTAIYLFVFIMGCRGVEYFFAYLTFTGGVIGLKVHYDFKSGGTPPGGQA